MLAQTVTDDLPPQVALDASGNALVVFARDTAVVNGTASVNWPAVGGATSYVLSAGTTLGGTQYMAPTNLGTSTGASASGLPPGFTAWVRVFAVNACGQQSAAVDFLVQ